VQPNYVPAPNESSGPLLSRLPNRSLPPLEKSRTWLKTLPAFAIVIALSSLAIFNYQKSSSSTVNSILYALRTNETAREVLGDEIYFASKVPWISGELNPLQGRIDISFWVKGRHGIGKVRFVSTRKKRDKYVSFLLCPVERGCC
jgi:cytochrome c oxidase assembly factor 1